MAFLSEDDEFLSVDDVHSLGSPGKRWHGDFSGDFSFSEDEIRTPTRSPGRRAGGRDARRLDESPDLSLEFESREGVIVTSALVRDLGSHQTISARRRKPRPSFCQAEEQDDSARVSGGVVRDPLLAPGDGEQSDRARALDRRLCSRGARVVLTPQYARERGLRHLVGAVGALEERHALGRWLVRFPGMHRALSVQVGDGGVFGLRAADLRPATGPLAAPVQPTTMAST